MRLKLLVSSSIGNALEWFDFSLCGYLAVILAELFYPQAHSTLSLAMAFSVYAIGFFMRPLGAVLFAYYADRHGRKTTLSYSIILMALATTVIGLLPDYATVGVWAGYLLLACRLLQGLAIGGEFGTSAVYILEHAPASQRGLYGAYTMLGTYGGLLFGAMAVALLHNVLSLAQIKAYGWRLPFLLSCVLGAIGLYIRWRMSESPQFIAAQSHQKLLTNPIATVFKQAPKQLLLAFVLIMQSSLCFTITFIFMPFYLQHYFNFAAAKSSLLNCICMALGAGLLLAAGAISDKLGRKPIVVLAGLLCALTSYPLFLQFIQQPDIVHACLLQLSLTLFTSLICGVNTSILTELFATEVRCSGFSLAYNLANALFGGTALLVLTVWIAKTSSLAAPAYYLTLCSLVVAFCFSRASLTKYAAKA